MSYSISFGPIIVEEYKHFNFTSNLAKFFHNFIDIESSKEEFNLSDDHPTSGLQSLNGLSGKQIAQILKESLKIIRSEELADLEREYDPANDWGSVLGAIYLIIDLLILSLEHPNSSISVHY